MNDDIKKLYEKITGMERMMSGMIRMGTVHKTEKGKVQVKWQPGDGGGNGDDYLSTMIRNGRSGVGTSHHAYAEGENVMVVAWGGNLDHAVIMPAAHSDNNPLDGEASTEYDTIRYRKPPEEDKNQQQQQQGSKGGGGGQGQYGSGSSDQSNAKKRKDADEDHQGKDGHDKFWRKVGNKAEVDLTPKRAYLRWGDGSVEISDGKAVVKYGKTAWTLEEGKATCKADKIYLDGEVYLGGEGAADKVATEKTRDSRGLPLLPPFAEKAKAK